MASLLPIPAMLYLFSLQGDNGWDRSSACQDRAGGGRVYEWRQQLGQPHGSGIAMGSGPSGRKLGL